MPNPFTHQTIFDFDIAEQGAANLSIYNSLGELVKTLVNETKPAGSYQVLFDAEYLEAGVYFYTLKTAEGSIAKKMILTH